MAGFQVKLCVIVGLLLIHRTTVKASCFEEEDSSEESCEDLCDAPDSINYNLESLVAVQPQYVTFLPNEPLFLGVDNICYKFTPLREKGSYLLDISTVYSNDLNTTYSYTITQKDGGVFLIGSATCTMQLSVFAGIVNYEAKCVLVLTYTCFLFGDCPMDCRTTLPVMGLSPLRHPISEECFSRVQLALHSHDIPDQDYYTLPMKKPSNCWF